MQNVGTRRAGEAGKIRKPVEPTFIIWNDRSDLRLLQHEFGDKDRIGIARTTPRQVATVFPIPCEQGAPEGNTGRVVCFDEETFNVQRSTFNERLLHLDVGRWTLDVGRLSSLQMNSYTHALSTDQATKLRILLEDLGFIFSAKPYTLFFAQKNKLSVAVYEKGPKVLLQGKGVEEFVQFELEPKILGEAKLGYEEVHSPEMFEPHFGIDESGKGDFFGPLVIAGVYVNRLSARKFLDASVQDSKRITSDARIRALAKIIRQTVGNAHEVVSIGPERYNQLYAKFGNLNSLLGWGHARVIENLLAKKPNCPRALSDKFADVQVIENALLAKGRAIKLDQKTKAESDVAVAAASILAREAFIDWLDKRGRAMGVKLGRGVSDSVKSVARQLVEKNGAEILAGVAKIHFRTAHEIAPEDFAAPAARRIWRR